MIISFGKRRRVVPPPAVVVAALALSLAGCTGLEEGGFASDTPSPKAGGRAVGPLDNPDGTRPGLAPISADADREEGRRLIEELPAKGRGPRTGYDRDEFGYAWMDDAGQVPLAGNDCDTRNDVLKRDGEALRLRPGSDCVVVAMTLADPYTGRTLEWRKEDAAEVQVDHVIPLSYGWQMGASRWSDGRRERLANDPLNLMPVEGRVNSAKGDSGPASWLPPSKAIRCAYVVRFAQVADRYDLAVTSADKRMMLAQCAG